MAQLGSYETKDGQTHEMGDANFDYSSMITEYKDQLELTDQQKLLPSFWGVGRLRDLQQSTALSKDLQDILTQYANATTKAEQIQLLPKLLDAWAKTDPNYTSQVKLVAANETKNSGRTIRVNPGQYQNREIGLKDPKVLEAFNEAKDKIGLIDAFCGRKTTSLYYINDADIINYTDQINTAYNNISRLVYDTLSVQTRLLPYEFSTILKEVDNTINPMDIFNQRGAVDPTAAISDMVDLYKAYPKDFDFDQMIDQSKKWIESMNSEQLATLREQVSAYNTGDLLGGRLKILDANETNYTAADKNDWILTSDKNTIIHGRSDAEHLSGGAGNDSLYGDDGDDIIIGGKGDDYLVGGDGSDTYVFFKGDGNDTIYNYDYSAGRKDIVQFKDVASTDVKSITFNDRKLVIHYGDNDSITINNDVDGRSYQINTFQFTDKSLTRDELMALLPVNIETGSDYLDYHFGDTNNQIKMDGYNRLFTEGGDDIITTGTKGSLVNAGSGNDKVYGGSGDDRVYGGSGNDHLDGGAGNDELHGGSGNDYLTGGVGNDSLYGDDGDDIIIGGKGDDYLVGGDGSDTYVFSKGDGNDTIYNYDYSAGHNDVVKFTDINAEQLYFYKDNNNLCIKNTNSSDTITIQNWYSSSNYHVNEFLTANGKVLSEKNVDQLVNISKDYFSIADNNALCSNQEQFASKINAVWTDKVA